MKILRMFVFLQNAEKSHTAGSKRRIIFSKKKWTKIWKRAFVSFGYRCLRKETSKEDTAGIYNHLERKKNEDLNSFPRKWLM